MYLNSQMQRKTSWILFVINLRLELSIYAKPTITVVADGGDTNRTVAVEEDAIKGIL